MPPIYALALHRSGAHRSACLSLYRALLRQATRLTRNKPAHNPEGTPTSTTPPNPTRALQELIRYRFRHDRTILSQSKAFKALTFGTSTLDTIAASNQGSRSALTRLTTLISSATTLASQSTNYRDILARTKPPSTTKHLAKLAHHRTHANKLNQLPRAGSAPVLTRPVPLSSLSSPKRLVPYLITAHGIPFLRYGKPQPVSLGRYIRQQRKKDLQRWNHKKKLSRTLIFAEAEDEWDGILRMDHGVEDDGGRYHGSRTMDLTSALMEEDGGDDKGVDLGTKWVATVQFSNQQIAQRIQETTQKRAQIGAKMWNVMMREREMAESEKTARTAQRRAAWEQRQGEDQ